MSNIANLSPVRRAYLIRRVRAVSRLIPDSLDQIKAAYIRGMSLVWHNEADIGPAEVLEELGTNAASLFIEGDKLLTFILASDPDWSYPTPTYEFTLNPDGTVTLGAYLHDPEL